MKPTENVCALLHGLSDVLGTDLDPHQPEAWLPRLGGMARMIGESLRSTAMPTMFSAGYQPNVVPSHAEAMVDVRYLPGDADHVQAVLETLIGPGLDQEVVLDNIPVEASFECEIADQMCSALTTEDPAARPLPYLMSGGTDPKSFSRLGTRCFGFCPLLLPPELDFSSLFHGVDERVPVEPLTFGVRVLDRLFTTG